MQTELSAYALDVFGTAGLPEKPAYKVIFVAPLGAEIPDDGVFKYTTINDLSDVGAVAERSVILFREDQNAILSVLSKEADHFARSVEPLFGVPGSTYGVWFDDATFGKDRIAYGAFVAELRSAAELAAQTAANSQSGTDIERGRYTTRSGNVRFNETITAGDDSDVDL